MLARRPSQRPQLVILMLQRNNSDCCCSRSGQESTGWTSIWTVNVRSPWNAGTSRRRRRDPQIVDRRSRHATATICCVSTRTAGTAGSAAASPTISSANYVDTTFGLGSVVHGFFADGVLRGAAELRPLGRAFAREAEAALQHRGRLAEPRRRLGAARPHAARRPQPRHQDPAHGLPRQQPPDAGTGAQIRRRAELRFRRRGRRGRGARGRRRCRCCGNSWPTIAALPPPSSMSSRDC